MRVLFALLILPALVLAAPEKRFVVDTLLGLVNADAFKADLQKLIDTVGSDPTEALCEQTLHTYVSGLADSAVPLTCHSLQELFKYFHIVPDTTTTTTI